MRLGDFLYIHREANPRWHFFFDMHDNLVMHGGQGNSTDVIVKIKQGSRSLLEPRLMAYAKELVARHDEVLHEEGEKLFHAVTITLPYPFMKENPDLEVKFHTGSGCSYDQDEIAYEIMAALSEVPVLKALAERERYGFVREDTINDGKVISYRHPNLSISVVFEHGREIHHPILITLHSLNDVSVVELFKKTMFDELSSYVEAKAEKPMLCQEGGVKYENEKTGVVTEVIVSFGDSVSFSVSAPHTDWVAFNRLKEAERIMDALHNNLVRYREDEVVTS